MSPTRWLGDLSTCFLLDDGWAFRLKVNRYHLKGRGGWQLPVSMGEAIGVSRGERAQFTCSIGSSEHSLWVEGRDGAYAGGEIDLPLRHHGCRDGDLVFVVFRDDSYELVARKQSELKTDDPLGSLLWHCGLDPNDEELRADPWRRLARALGGAGQGPEVVADRLERRGDKRLLALLEQAVSQNRTTGTANWPPFWQYVLPAQAEGELFVLQRADGTARVAVGVLDAMAQPPPGLVLSDGAVLWMTASPADEPESIDRLLGAPPVGLVPSGRKRSWTRWMLADHVGRRAFLLEQDWRIEYADASWVTENGGFDDLCDALITMDDGESEQAAEPSDRIHTTYPRNGLAFKSMVADALAEGLAMIEGVASRGYRATFSDGHTREGMSLPDVMYSP